MLNIPFGVYNKLNTQNVCDYITESKNKLDKVIYGQEPVKMHILEIISQYFSNQDCLGNIFGVYGPIGVGKTTIIKEGLSVVLQRPFSFISLGGAQDSSFLDGHSYTYEGSTYGKIADCLIKSKCMNPIIYFDELDKISNTAKGEEISNLLIHITDESQNMNFQDKYFNGVNLDLSAQLTVVMIAFLASVGAAGVPHAGLVMIFIVLQSVGISNFPGVDIIVGGMLAVDRPLDMLRTMVNVTSDSIGAAIIAKSEGEKLY